MTSHRSAGAEQARADRVPGQAENDETLVDVDTVDLLLAGRPQKTSTP